MYPEDVTAYEMVQCILSSNPDILKLETHEDRFLIKDSLTNTIAAFPTFAQVHAFVLGFQFGFKASRQKQQPLQKESE